MDGQQAGTVWIETVPESPEAILGIFLATSAHFGRGIGREAIGLTMAEFRAERGDLPIALRVRETNGRAIACYRKAGFVTVAVREKLTASGVPLRFVRMIHRPGSGNP